MSGKHANGPLKRLDWLGVYLPALPLKNPDAAILFGTDYAFQSKPPAQAGGL
jgi:hypothetical protein